MRPPFVQESRESDAVTTSASNVSPETLSCSNTEDHLSTIRDDTGMRKEPTKLVDYLWKKEDIWCSRRHIVTNGETKSGSRRLENA